MSERTATSEPIRLPWGGGTLEVRLPGSWRVLGELRPKSVAAPPDAALPQGVAPAGAVPDELVAADGDNPVVALGAPQALVGIGAGDQ